jgi:hypothetical protein
MELVIVGPTGAEILDEEPVCGSDLCTRCGACLHCDPEGTCSVRGASSPDLMHSWLVLIR